MRTAKYHPIVFCTHPSLSWSRCGIKSSSLSLLGSRICWLPQIWTLGNAQWKFRQRMQRIWRWKAKTAAHCGGRARQSVANCWGKAISPAVADSSFTKLLAHSLTFISSHSKRFKLPSRGDHSADYRISLSKVDTSYITSISLQIIKCLTYWWRFRITDLFRSEISKGSASTNVSIDRSSKRC